MIREIRFKFEKMWLEVVGFHGLIKRCWEEVEIDDFSGFVVAVKIKRCLAKSFLG